MNFKLIGLAAIIAFVYGCATRTGSERHASATSPRQEAVPKSEGAASSPGGILTSRGSLVANSPSTRAGLVPLGDRPVDSAETQQLDALFSTAFAAMQSVPPGPDAGAQRRAIHAQLQNELESFATNHADSAWSPSIHSWLAHAAQMKSQYSAAMDDYLQAWSVARTSADPNARVMAHQSSGSLAKLLALTGRVDDFDYLDATVRSEGGGSGSAWTWAREVRNWARKHPEESFKCGLYCLDQLVRITQPGQFKPKDITETKSSTNGFTAADLINIATRAGLRVHAAALSDFTTLPVPSIIHLRSEHFVVVRERRGNFYNVLDTVAFGPRWLLASEVEQEATGCVIV